MNLAASVEFLARTRGAIHAGRTNAYLVGRVVGSGALGAASSARVLAMNAANEFRGIATHLVLYPLGVLGTRPRPFDPRPDTEVLDTPVVQVHGYFHNRSGFFFLERALRSRGFRWVHAMNYNPLGSGIPALAERLARDVEDVRRLSRSRKVHLVGHSLGGLVARWYLQELGGDRWVDRCVTIGTPHRGTYVAYLGPGEAAAQMRPGSEVLRRLDASFTRTTTSFVNLYSELDMLVVPASSGVLPDLPRVHNHKIRDFGHLSLLMSPELVDLVTKHLAAPLQRPLAEVRPLRPSPPPTEQRVADF